MEIKGNYLHLKLKRTKREIPYHENIGAHRYPKQNLDYLNAVQRIWIKDNYRIIPENAPDYRKYSDPQIRLVYCRIIRFDAEAPWVAVYVSEEEKEGFEYIVVGSSKDPETTQEYPLLYPIQYDKDNEDIIGLYGYIQSGSIYNDNMLETFDFPGVVIKSDISEPALDVIIGQYSEDEYMVFLSSEVWFDIQGTTIVDPVMTAKFKMMEVRRQLLEGRTPYGINQN